MIRLVQIVKHEERRVACVEGSRLALLSGVTTSYALLVTAIDKECRVAEVIQSLRTEESLDYDPVYADQSDWKILPPLDHPDDPARCLITGTGLTHLGSARDRNAMHIPDHVELTDSLRMFESGMKGGSPEPGEVGVSPEWFYKGNGRILRAHNAPLEIPSFAEDGGEEAEIACAYIIGRDGNPHRVGMCVGNEFSNHAFEKQNYLYLAASKLYTAAVGPELVVDPDFESVTGYVTIERDGHSIWYRELQSGEKAMCHNLRNIEHHHFKFPAHRVPGDLHIHFLGTPCLSFGDGVVIENGDRITVSFEALGRPLINSVVREEPSLKPVTVHSLA